MSYRPDERDWMAYLYGELDDETAHKVDQYILQNPDAARELQRFQSLRKVLSTVEDKEVIAPPIVIGDRTAAQNVRDASADHGRSLWMTPWLKAVASAAACTILIILAGWATDAQLSISNNELRIGFGSPPQPVVAEVPEKTLTEADVRGMIQASLNENNNELQVRLEETRRKLDASIKASLAFNSGKMDELMRTVSSASQEQILQYVDGIRAENTQQVKDYLVLTSTEQKKYIENLLVDFAKYLQQQRADDLRLVQMRMNNLEQNTDLFKQETEHILSSIITTVGVPVSSEMKN